jgi:hypothetical protein
MAPCQALPQAGVIRGGSWQKIDYNLNENPPLTVRRVLDELVELADDFYLGKAHVRWGWRPGHGWKTFAYFTLTK